MTGTTSPLGGIANILIDIVISSPRHTSSSIWTVSIDTGLIKIVWCTSSEGQIAVAAILKIIVCWIILGTLQRAV